MEAGRTVRPGVRSCVPLGSSIHAGKRPVPRMIFWWLLVPLCAARHTCEDTGLLQIDTQSGQTSLGSSLVVVSGCVSNAGSYAEVCVTWIFVSFLSMNIFPQTKVSNRSLPATSL